MTGYMLFPTTNTICQYWKSKTSLRPEESVTCMLSNHVTCVLHVYYMYQVWVLTISVFRGPAYMKTHKVK